MMLIISGLPPTTRYNDLKMMLKQKCNIVEFILDNLVSEKDGSKKVRIGLADEAEGHYLMKCLNGFSLQGHLLRVDPLGKGTQNMPPQNNFAPSYNQPRNDYQPSNFGNQAPQQHVDPMGRPDPWGATASNNLAPNQWENNNSYEQPGSFGHQQMPQPQRSSMPMGHQNLAQNHRPDQGFGHQLRPNLIDTNPHRNEARSHVLRTVEIIDTPIVRPPIQTNRYSINQGYGEGPKPNTISKENFQGPSQPLYKMDQQINQTSSHYTDPCWVSQANDQKDPFAKSASTPYNDDRKFFQSSQPDQRGGILPKVLEPRIARDNFNSGPNFVPQRSAPMERQPSPRRKMSPGRCYSPTERRISPFGRKMSPPGRKDSPPRRRFSPFGSKISPTSRKMSPPGRRISPFGRKFSPRRIVSPPGRKISPGRRNSPGRRISPFGRRVSPPGKTITLSHRRISPPRRNISGPGRELSPSGRRISPFGRRMSPERKIPSTETRMGGRPSPSRDVGRRISPNRRAVSLRSQTMRYSPNRLDKPSEKYDPDSRSNTNRLAFDSPQKAQLQGLYSGGYRPSIHENVQYPIPGARVEQRISPWQHERDGAMFSQAKKPEDDRRMPFDVSKAEIEKQRMMTRGSRSPGRRDRSPVRDRFKKHSPSPRSPRRSWALEKRRSPDIRDAPPPPVWPGDKAREEPEYSRPSFEKLVPHTRVPWESKVDVKDRDQQPGERRFGENIKKEWNSKFVEVKDPDRRPEERRFGEDIKREWNTKFADVKDRDRRPDERRFGEDSNIRVRTDLGARPSHREPTPPRHFQPQESFIEKDEKYSPKFEPRYDSDEEISDRKYAEKRHQIKPDIELKAETRRELNKFKDEFRRPEENKFDLRQLNPTQIDKEFEEIHKKAMEFNKRVDEHRRMEERKKLPKDDHFRREDAEKRYDDRRYHDEEDKRDTYLRKSRFDERPSTSDEFRKREPEWKSNENKTKNNWTINILSSNVKSKREKAVEELAEKILTRQGVDISGVMLDRITDELKMALSRRIHDMFGDKDLSFIEIIIKFNAKYNEKDEDLIFDEVMASFPSHYRKRRAPGPSEISAKVLKHTPEPNFAAEGKHHYQRGPVKYSKFQDKPSYKKADIRPEHAVQSKTSDDAKPKPTKSTTTAKQTSGSKATATGTKPITTVAKAAEVKTLTPGVKPTTAGTKPTTAGTKPTKIEAKPTTTGTKRTTTGAKPTTETKPVTNEAKPTTAGAKSTTTGAKLTTTRTKSTTTVAKPLTPGTKPTAKPSTVVAKFDTALVKPTSEVQPASSIENVKAESGKVNDEPTVPPNADGLYELTPILNQAIDDELELIMLKVWQALPDNPPVAEKLIVDMLKDKAGDQLNNVLGLNVTKRLLNIHNPFYVKVHFSGKPQTGTLKAFLQKYKVSAFKRIESNANTFAAQFRTLQDFDRICEAKTLSCGGAKVTITPCYRFTHCPEKIKTHYDTNVTETESDDDSEDDLLLEKIEVKDEKTTNGKAKDKLKTDAPKDTEKKSENDKTKNAVNKVKKADCGNVKTEKKENETEGLDVGKNVNTSIVKKLPDNKVKTENATSKPENKITKSPNENTRKNVEGQSKVNAVSKKASKKLPDSKALAFETRSLEDDYDLIDEYYYSDDMNEELDDEEILLLMSQGIIVDECTESDED